MTADTALGGRLAIGAAFAVLGIAGCGSDSSSSAAPAGSSSDAGGGGGSAINIKDFAFSPQTITVKVGATVTWSNKDGSTHTATADDKSFDTNNIAAGATGSATFNTAGTIKYHCNIHQYMTGTITVTS